MQTQLVSTSRGLVWLWPLQVNAKLTTCSKRLTWTQIIITIRRATGGNPESYLKITRRKQKSLNLIHISWPESNPMGPNKRSCFGSVLLRWASRLWQNSSTHTYFCGDCTRPKCRNTPFLPRSVTTWMTGRWARGHSANERLAYTALLPFPRNHSEFYLTRLL